MKRLFILLILTALALPVFAQTHNAETSMYCFNLPVEKIIPSNEGYIVQYRKLTFGYGIIGIPNEWFSEAAGRADMVKLPPGKNWPTMTIFYNEGKFSHVRLYVHRLKSHTTWGAIPMGTDVSSFFSDKDSFDIQY